MDNKYSECMEKPTPNGGKYAITYFSDKDLNPCTKHKAVHIEIHEFDKNDNCINITYSLVSIKKNERRELIPITSIFAEKTVNQLKFYYYA